MQTFVSFSKCTASPRRFIITDSNEIPSQWGREKKLIPLSDRANSTPFLAYRNGVDDNALLADRSIVVFSSPFFSFEKPSMLVRLKKREDDRFSNRCSQASV